MLGRCVEDAGLLESISDERGQLVRKQVATAFVKREGHNRLFWWNYFERDQQAFLAISANEPSNLVRKALPPDQEVWLIIEGGLRGRVFKGNTTAVITAIDRCYLNEYYIVPESIDWLICECHEAFAYAIGEIAVSWLEKAARANA